MSQTSEAARPRSPGDPIPATMRAAVVPELGGPLEIREIPVPRIRPDQILVRVHASGVCHTDLHAAEGDWPVKPSAPFVPGHEGVGVVAAVGERVEGIAVGDRVGVPWLHTACGRCRHCGTGWETLCPTQQNTGYSVDGGFAEYVAADPDYVGRIPDGLDMMAAAPVLCAGVTVYKGLKELECQPGDVVVVSGIGGLGHMAVQYARAMGFRVAAVDVRADKLELARTLGAEWTFDASTSDPVGGLLAAIPDGARGALVTAVHPTAFEQALGMLGRRGTMALVGLPPGDFDLPIFDVVLSRKTVRGSIVGTRQDLAESLDFAARGLVKPHFETARLEDINDIFAAMKRGEIEGRIVLDMNAG